MAKKVRKPRASSPRTYAQSSVMQTLAPAAPAAKSESVAAPVAYSQSSAKDVDLAAEYRIVGRDLRMLLVTAAVMFAVLIATNVVIGLVS